ncbi:pyridoxamine 5'-phosphate oxidase family protein [Paenibacillus rhizophilus]|uniref:Uncharacterized protein n=1 Tax=Paenibacillus rhizophilus TaxID=1850366 RepID=A0A3N9Q159_9BACL|nr:pyridoxamine 5'-phosphate oxidase family protein [Paenibacillus rhizophilus]RQW11236.1 hypothetical protein EH198_13030 [Paenibacillus rhizophilus]
MFSNIDIRVSYGLTACTQNNTATPVPTPTVQSTAIVNPTPTSTHALPPLTSAASETSPVFQQDLTGLNDQMKRIVEFLTANKELQMATVGTDRKPAIRAIQFQFFENGRIYFQTDTNASLYKDLQKLPYIELVSSNRDYTESLRVSAGVVFKYNYKLIDRTLEMFPNIKKIYGSADNPILTMFYIEHGSASIYEFSNDRQENTLRYEW